MSNPFLDAETDNYSQYNNAQSQLEATRTKTIESQRNAMRSLATSEQIGVNTTTELMDQGEKLDRTNQRLTEIEEKQKVSDKHIRNLKSGFIGGLVGLFKKKEVAAPVSNDPKVYDTYRNPDMSYTVEEFNRRPVQNTNISSSESGSYQDQFDRNINDMSQGVGRLQNMAKNIGTELDRQNDLLEEMAPKTEKINTNMRNQNKQLNVLLYGKPK